MYPAGKTLKISVVVPAFNEEKLLGTALDRIRASAAAFADRGWEWELIVCDNNSTDATSAIAREHGATVVFEPINQISSARNAGARAATGDWLLFVDADSFPEKQLFEAVARRLAEDRIDAGGAVVHFDHPTFWASVGVGVWNLTSRFFGWMAGSFIFCRASLFREIGGFSEEYFAAEEIDLSKRIVKARGRKALEIISETGLKTSARKMHLYGRSDHLRMLANAVLRPNKALKDRDQCLLWYDGKR